MYCDCEKEELKYSEVTISHQRSNMDWTGLERVPVRWQSDDKTPDPRTKYYNR